MSKAPVIGLVSLYTIENNGTRHIAALLRREGFKTVEIYFKDWVNNRFDPPTETEISNLIKVIKDTELDVVGFSVRASAYHDMARDLTRRVKEETGIPVIWGGMHTTFLPDDAIECADIIINGEAEYPMLDLAKRLAEGKDYDDIPNLWMKKDGRVIKNEIRPLEMDLDALPFRDFHSEDKYFIDGSSIKQGDPYVHDPVFQMKCNRGCPFAECSYCDAPILTRLYEGKGCYYRNRSVDSVIEELEYAKKHFKNLKRIRFDDEVFPVKKEWIEKFCRLYKEKINLPFEILLHPKTVKEESLKMLMDAGLDFACMGVQNTDRINRELYNRNISNEKILEVARIINKIGLKISYHFVLDDPISTPEDKQELFNLLMEIPRPYEIYLFSLTIFPTSVLAENLLQRGIITENEVEGKAKKAFTQWRVDLNYDRQPLDVFWISLYVLTSKSFIPKSFLIWLSKREFLKKHPMPLVIFSQVVNLFKMAWLAFEKLIRGELNLTLIKRWLNIKSLITQ